MSDKKIYPLYDAFTHHGFVALAFDIYVVITSDKSDPPKEDDEDYRKARAMAEKWRNLGLTTDDAVIHELLVALAAERNVEEDAYDEPLAEPIAIKVVPLIRNNQTVPPNAELRPLWKLCLQLADEQYIEGRDPS